MSQHKEYEIYENDVMVASCGGPQNDALREAHHYAAQYNQDGGIVEIFEVERKIIWSNIK